MTVSYFKSILLYFFSLTLFFNSITIISTSKFIFAPMEQINTIPGFQKLWQLIIQTKREIGALYFYAVFSGLLQLVVPVGIQAIVGFTLGAQMVTSVYLLIVLVVLSVWLVGILQIKQMRVVESIQQQTFVRNAFEFSETIPNIALDKSEKYYLPEKANRFFDTVILQKGFSKILLDIPQAFIQLFLGLILLSFYHQVFIVFSFLLCFVLWLIFYLSGKQGIASSIAESNYKYQVADWLEDLARVIRSFKFSHGSHLNLRKTDTQVTSYLKARNTHFRILLLQFRTLLALKIIITSTMLIAGTILLVQQKLNVGEFIAAEIVILSIIAAVEKLISNLENVYDVITALEKLSAVTNLPREQSGSNLLSNSIDKIDLQLDQIHFAYQANKPVLQNISIQIPWGNKVAVTGMEASGKSTLLMLLSGMIQHYQGNYLLNDIPFHDFQLQSFREIASLYSHKQDVFKGSVLENITLSRSTVDSQQIYALAKDLGIAEFLYKLPKGLDTEIDSEGLQFPSSTLRKIMLLRALIHKPKLVFMEEPWYGFTPEEKNQMLHYLLSKTTSTVIIVTADPIFCKECDQVIALHNGQITSIQTKNHD